MVSDPSSWLLWSVLCCGHNVYCSILCCSFFAVDRYIMKLSTANCMFMTTERLVVSVYVRRRQD